MALADWDGIIFDSHATDCFPDSWVTGLPQAYTPGCWSFLYPLLIASASTLDLFELHLIGPQRLQGDQPVNPRGNQPWILTGRTVAEAETPANAWCEEPTHWKSPWCCERLNKRRRGQQRVRWLESVTNSGDVSLSELQDSGGPGSRCTAVHGQQRAGRDLGMEQQQMHCLSPSPAF